jgi:RNA polymerase sigma factor (sigma-70 family)
MKLDPAIRDQVLGTVPSLRAFAISLCGNIDRADDLVQETLLRALSHIDSFEPGTNMPAWLFTILRNLFRSEYRKRRREVEDADGRYADTLKSHPEQTGRVEFEEFRTAVGPARGADPRGRVRFLLRRRRLDLRLRRRHDQEPRQPRPHAACRPARNRQCRRFWS